MNKFNWMKNDPAGFMFSTINSSKQSRMIRFSAVLNEDVKPEILKKASDFTISKYPIFQHRAKWGFFWGYLEKSNILPAVTEEKHRPAVLRKLGKHGEPEIEILYYKRRISVEANHILADGTGFMEFLKTLVAKYLVLCGADKNEFEGIRYIKDSDEDYGEWKKSPYYDYYRGEREDVKKRENTYVIPREYKPSPYCNYIFGIMPVEQVYRNAKNYGRTVTEYFAASLIYAIIKASDKAINENILIAVPCNLRKHFPSNSVRNFSNDAPIVFNPKGKKDVSFNEIISAIEGQLKSKDTPAFHRAFLSHAISLVENPVLRTIPFFIKHIGFYQIQKATHKRDMTVMLSNLGNIKIPQKMSDSIERFEFLAGDVRVYDLAMFTSVLSVNGYINFCFNFSGEDTSIPMEFFRHLVKSGIVTRIESADENGIEKCTDNDIKSKKCIACGVELGEEYTRCPLCGNAPINNPEKKIPFSTALYPQPYVEPKKGKVKFVKPYISTEKIKAYFNW